jgi:hypothetical protein
MHLDIKMHCPRCHAPKAKNGRRNCKETSRANRKSELTKRTDAAKLTGDAKKMKNSLQELVQRTRGRDTAAGSDIIYAGDGADHAWAGSGDDVVYGEGGADQLNGEDGNDIVFGGMGDDVRTIRMRWREALNDSDFQFCLARSAA